jgi:hypothetical protein
MITISYFKAKNMRIQLTNYAHPEDDPDIIVHGSRPKRAEKHCGNCARKNNCSILNTAIRTMSIIAPMPSKPSRPVINSYGQVVQQPEETFFPLPMPCQGSVWMVTKNEELEKNPLIQRLGLSNVSEPISYENKRISSEDKK